MRQINIEKRIGFVGENIYIQPGVIPVSHLAYIDQTDWFFSAGYPNTPSPFRKTSAMAMGARTRTMTINTSRSFALKVP